MAFRIMLRRLTPPAPTSAFTSSKAKPQNARCHDALAVHVSVPVLTIAINGTVAALRYKRASSTLRL